MAIKHIHPLTLWDADFDPNATRLRDRILGLSSERYKPIKYSVKKQINTIILVVPHTGKTPLNVNNYLKKE